VAVRVFKRLSAIYLSAPTGAADEEKYGTALMERCHSLKHNLTIKQGLSNFLNYLAILECR
jgi:hypothetical protein